MANLIQYFISSIDRAWFGIRISIMGCYCSITGHIRKLQKDSSRQMMN